MGFGCLGYRVQGLGFRIIIRAITITILKNGTKNTDFYIEAWILFRVQGLREFGALMGWRL